MLQFHMNLGALGRHVQCSLLKKEQSGYTTKISNLEEPIPEFWASTLYISYNVLTKDGFST
jgi:hypothetical protein